MLGIRMNQAQGPNSQFEMRAIPHWACTAAMGHFFHPNIPTECYQREDKRCGVCRGPSLRATRSLTEQPSSASAYYSTTS